MAEMAKCELGGSRNGAWHKILLCGVPLPVAVEAKPGPDYLKSIDARSVGTIKRIAIWWLVLSILGLLIGFLAAAGAFR